MGLDGDLTREPFSTVARRRMEKVVGAAGVAGDGWIHGGKGLVAAHGPRGGRFWRREGSVAARPCGTRPGAWAAARCL